MDMKLFEIADTDADTDMQLFDTADTDADMNFLKNRGHGHGADKPRTCVSDDLCSTLNDNKTEAPPGFEPGAAALQVQRSTTEL